MKNREFLNTLVQSRIETDNEFYSEIRYHMFELDREDDPEDPYDFTDAVFDVEDRAELHKAAGVLKAARELLIEVGFYREISAEELSQWTSNRGKVTCNFRLNKKMWWADDSIETWKDGTR